MVEDHSVEEYYKRRYEADDIPWDYGRADFNLVNVVTDRPVDRCRTLDIGCGTGDNAIWLASQGFQVTGIDTADLAVDKAKSKAAKAGAECDFLVLDFLGDVVPGTPYGFAFDRGCFHSFDSEDERELYARRVAECLAEGGLWFTIAGNADEKRDGPGPPRRSASDIVKAVEARFEILSLVTGHIASKRPNPARAWIGLMRKRGGPA